MLAGAEGGGQGLQSPQPAPAAEASVEGAGSRVPSQGAGSQLSHVPFMASSGVEYPGPHFPHFVAVETMGPIGWPSHHPLYPPKP